MSKALVIKNVDFSTNKLTTVTLIDPIPCTAISLSKSSTSFTALGTDTITATVTPSNTTDTVVWTTSDATVATVNNGVITAVGIGTATITATCGEQSATCSVSVSVILDDDDFTVLLHRYNSGTNLSANPVKDYVGCYGEESGAFLKIAEFLIPTATPSGIKALSGAVDLYAGKYPLLIPKNATAIEFTSSELTLDTVYYSWLDSTSECTYSTQGKGCKAVSNVLNNNSVSSNKITISIPDDIDDLDSIAFGVKFTTEVDENTTFGLTVTFA